MEMEESAKSLTQKIKKVRELLFEANKLLNDIIKEIDIYERKKEVKK